MLESISNKLTKGMLWLLVVVFSALIFTLAALTGAYAYVVYNSDNVQINFGKLAVIAQHNKEISSDSKKINSAQREFVLNTLKKLDKIECSEYYGFINRASVEASEKNKNSYGQSKLIEDKDYKKDAIKSLQLQLKVIDEQQKKINKLDNELNDLEKRFK